LRFADRGLHRRGGKEVLLGACCATLATLVPVALYQTGVLTSLPDPPSSIFDSEKITKSKEAFPLGVPDAILGIASFGVTLTLALLAKRSPRARQLLGAKLALDGSAAAFNVVRQVVSFGKLCSWCTGTAVAAGVMVYAGRGAMGEAWSTARAATMSGLHAAQGHE
jgi:uncharacterized membrane protein